MLNPRSDSRKTTRAMLRRPGLACFEALEQRCLLAAYTWTNDEVYLLELVNRARANPMAEAARLGIDLTASLTSEEIARLVTSEPLALNEFLTNAARLHSQDMGLRGFFAHVNPDGLDPTNRAQDAGYDGSAGENIAAGWASIDIAHLEWLKSVGHRRNMLSLHTDFDADFHYSEFGGGMFFQSVAPDDAERYTSYYTQEFGIQAGTSDLYLLGVVYDDSNTNAFYTPGEGRANVRVDIFTSLTEPAIGSYTTDNAGNYQIAVAPGTYTVVFTDLTTGMSKSQSVTIASANVKVDAQGAQLDQRIFSDNISGPDSVAYGSTNGADILTITTIDRFGNAIAFRQGASGQWNVADLNLASGAPQPTRQLVTWTDPTSGFTNAAAPSADGLLLFIHNSGTNLWAAYNLTDLIAGSELITSEVTVFQDSVSGMTVVGGLTAGGDMVIYTKLDSGTGWSSTNLTQRDIVPTGQQMPSFTGSLVGYATSWGGLNIVGLDADGNIQGLWWSPGMANWRVDNLSALTGAPTMTGGLTVFQTPWGAVNLAGIDIFGDVEVTWWVPGMDSWLTNNFNNDFGGPALEASSLASFVMPWGGLNVVGLDSQGSAWFYWWAPGMDTWQVTDLTGLIGGSTMNGTLRGVSSAAGTTSLVGKSGGSHVIRYWWAPGRDNWEVQDLTALT